ncbi:MAG TPA: cytochrome c biogenesis protein ResB, partial [Gemmataceae bacterium]|nr:cytochrome c biogenesis protein ResB [Gemmataceae bacterium]
WIAMIDLQGLAEFCKVFLGFGPDFQLPVKLPFPGGYTIGWLMFFNLAAAHAVRFKLTWKRSGIFMLHAGVVILLAGEFLTGQFAIETRMLIKDGDSSRFAISITEYELAVIDPSDPAVDQVVAVPGELLADADKGEWVTHPDLPFEFEVLEYMPNSVLRDFNPGESPRADRGVGLRVGVESKSKVKGTDTEGKINFPSAYLTIRDKGGEPLGTYLFTLLLEHRPQDVTVGGKTYKVAYRFKRTYKPYTVHVLSAEHKVYAGTNTPKDYASTVKIEDPELGEHGPIRIWMNHPMYYRGETFYQSSMSTDEDTGVKTTGLQVVKNPAWTAPYLACAMVALGMGAHFLIRLITFLRRGGAR